MEKFYFVFYTSDSEGIDVLDMEGIRVNVLNQLSYKPFAKIIEFYNVNI